jgi:hypothetical protein
MTKTPAERQKEYRDKRPFAGVNGNGERRVSAYVSTHASLALERLAARYGVTKREMLERLVINEEEKFLKTITLDSPDGEAYLAGLPVTP